MTVDRSAPRIAALEVAARTAIESWLVEFAGADDDTLALRFAGLPRRVGRTMLGIDPATADPDVDWNSFRLCDLAAAGLFAARAPGDRGSLALRLYQQGDADERRMVLKAMTVSDLGEAAVELLGAAHRQNDRLIFEAAFADADLAARLLPDLDYHRALLKAAFIDLPLERMLGAERRASPLLSSMLLDFMSEREAAGRPVWAGSLELAARAPSPGVVDRLRGESWQGADARRLGAARAMALLPRGPEREAVRSTVRDRLVRERAPEIRALLESIDFG